MKPVANPVSEFDAEKFADYVAKWQDALNLKDWRITRSRRKTRNMADVKIFIPDRLATWTIGNSFGGAKVDDYNGTRWGVDTGTLADVNGPQFDDYTEDNPKSWRSGFVILTWHHGRLMWPEIVRVWADNLIEYRGQIVDVSQE